MDNRIIVAIVALLTAVSALVAASLVAEENFTLLVLVVVILLGLAFTIFYSRWWLFVIFGFSTMNLEFFPQGIQVVSVHFAVILTMMFVVGTWWRPGGISSTWVTGHFKTFQTFFLLLGLYLLMHLYLNNTAPVPGEYVALNNAIKMVILIFGGFFIFWIAIHSIRSSHFPRKAMQICATLLVISLLVNMAIKMYGILFLSIGEAELGTEEMASTALYIPIVNAMENPHTLRLLGPLAVLFGSVLVGSRAPSHTTRQMHIFSIILILLGFLGSLMSMGRASVIFSVLFLSTVLLLRRRFLLFSVIPLFSLFTIIGVKVAYEYDSRLVPFPVQRAVAILPGMNMKEAASDIEGSSLWRSTLFEYAVSDWLSSARIIWTGRSTFALTQRDYSSVKFDPYWGGMRLALRKGATHNLATDLLLTIGLIGAILYFGAILSILRGMFQIYRSIPKNSEAHDWMLIALTFTAFSIVYGLVGGLWFSDWQAVLIALALCSASKLGPEDRDAGKFEVTRRYSPAA